MSEKKWETVEVEINIELKRQAEEVIYPMGLTLEQLLQMFFEWLVNPDTTEEAVAWLLKAKSEDEAQ